MTHPHKRFFFSFFTKSTTIHGIKYIGDRKSSTSVRFFWLFAFLLSITGCMYYANEIYSKWYVYPDIGLKVKLQSIRQAPFPAFTICPQSKINSRMLNYTTEFLSSTIGVYDMSEEERRYFEAALQVCIPAHINNVFNYTDDMIALDSNNIAKTVEKMTYKTNNTIMACLWRNIPFDCTKFMTKIMTSEGFCFTSNILDYSALFNENSLHPDFDVFKNEKDSSNWTMSGGYKSDSLDVYPDRIASGKYNGLIFLLITNRSDIDHVCQGPDLGFRVYWHLPGEIPFTWHRSVLIGIEQQATLIMQPTMIKTSDGLLRYEPDQRRCYFDGEKKLKFFKSYTKSNCDLECLAEFTLSECGCVKFSMPRDIKTPVCNFSKIDCYYKAENKWLENDKMYKDNKMPCGCYPPCTTIKYESTYFTTANFDVSGTLKAFAESVDDEYPK